MKEISAEEFLRRKANGEELILIDVRELWEFDEHNIGAKCFPLGELPQFLKELEPYKGREIIIHCKTGDRAKRAQKFLLKQGFKNVICLKGGIEAVHELA